MLVEAHQPRKSRNAGRIAGAVAVVLLCFVSIALTLSAEASAAARVGGALGAVAQTTTHELSSTAGATVGQGTGAAPAPVPSVPVGQPATPVQQATPAKTPLNTASSPSPPGPHGAGVGAVGSEARERIASTIATPPSAGRAAVRAIVHRPTAGTIVHTATAAVSASPSVAPVAVAVQRAGVSPSRAGEVVRAVTHTVIHTASPSQIVQTLADDASTLATPIAHRTRVDGAVQALTSSVAPRRAPATLPTIERPAGTRQSAAAPPQALVLATPAAAPMSSVVQSVAGPPIAPTSFVQDSFGGWRTGLASPGSEAATRTTAEAVLVTPAVPPGQSAVSYPARGAHPAPLPASPAPTPSPGGVSPATAGAAAGLAIALGLAALLMLAAPLALRRLRLDGESWRLAPLQLIADRPG